MDLIRGLGVDPGLANTGIGAVARLPDGTFRSLGVRLSRTAPDKDRRTRATTDDARRIRDHWTQVYDAIQLLKPHVVAIENYSTFEPADVRELRDTAGRLIGFLGSSVPSADELRQACASHLPELTRRIGDLAAVVSNGHKGIGLGQAAKTIAVFGATMAAAYTAGIPVYVFLPSDLKTRFGGGRSASKEDVGRGIEQVVSGLAAQVAEKVPQKTMREHVWDATAHGVLGIEAYMRTLGVHGLPVAAPQDTTTPPL